MKWVNVCVWLKIELAVHQNRVRLLAVILFLENIFMWIKPISLQWRLQQRRLSSWYNYITSKDAMTPTSFSAKKALCTCRLPRAAAQRRDWVPNAPIHTTSFCASVHKHFPISRPITGALSPQCNTATLIIVACGLAARTPAPQQCRWKPAAASEPISPQISLIFLWKSVKKSGAILEISGCSGHTTLP